MRSSGFRQGLNYSLSIALGYAPVAVTFGILARHAGMPLWSEVMMSIFVYAGAAQFIAIEMIQQGASVGMIGMTTLILNSRHVLMSLAVTPYFSQTKTPWLMGLAHGITDETFVLNTRLLNNLATEEERRLTMLGVNLGAYASWVVFTLIGGLIGDRLPTDFSGFQFAMLALFILLAAGTLNRRNFFTFAAAGLLGTVLKYVLPGELYLVLSVLIAAGLGTWWRRKNNVRRRREIGA